MPKPGQLCPTCLNLGDRTSKLWKHIERFEDVIVPHHQTTKDLVDSALGGCHLCCLLVVAFDDKASNIQEHRFPWISPAFLKTLDLSGRIQLRFYRSESERDFEDTVLEKIYLNVVCEGKFARKLGRLICSLDTGFQHNFPITCMPTIDDDNTGSIASFSRMRAWLENCQNNHTTCDRIQTHEPPLLPTRVLSVGNIQADCCYLQSGSGKRGQYATLSHCWGDPSFKTFSTTEDTISAREQGIKDEDLPKTFRDSVRICRELHIEYLWIDSLCIIQEQSSQADWSTQAPKMGDIYSSSVVTIAAAAAADSNEGCFKDRVGFLSWPCQIQLFDQTVHVSRSPKLAEQLGNPGDLYVHPPNLSPLYHRAWVLQEQILSPRSLVFTRSGLIWRCSTVATNERYPLGLSLVIPKARSVVEPLLFRQALFIKGRDGPEVPKIDIGSSWCKVVESLSSRKLTYVSDKLAAIAGLARRVASLTSDRYVAGIWSKDLILGLLWSTASPEIRLSRFPSWSWAAVDGPIFYLLFQTNGVYGTRMPTSNLITVESIDDPITCDEHPFGTSSNASLVVSGALLPVADSKTMEPSIFLGDHTFGKDCETEDLCTENSWFFLPVCVRHKSSLAYHVGGNEKCKISWEKSLQTGVDELQERNIVSGLVLRSAMDQVNTYSRVGILTINERMGTVVSRASFQERRHIRLV